MGKEKIMKPDAAVVKAMVAQAVCIDEKLKEIAGSERRQRQNAQTAAQKLHDARYRMGQVRDVLVYRLLADNTVDEKIMELLKTKQQQFDQFAEESVMGEESLKPDEAAWIGKMVEEEKQRLQEV